MKRKIIQINWETLKIIEKGVLAHDCPVEVYMILNQAFKEAGIPKIWLIEPTIESLK